MLFLLAMAVTTAPLDPAAWGDSHAGKELPYFVDGNECLFCHRATVGKNWNKNRHQLTVQPKEAVAEAVKALISAGVPEAAIDEARWALGAGGKRVRFLKPTGYGAAAILSALVEADEDGNMTVAHNAATAAWDDAQFAANCAGCHTSAFDTRVDQFATVALDCHTCHGVVPVEHTEDQTLVLFADDTPPPGRVEASICGSCHLRGGTSNTSGRPFPNNFVPGDNLFQDFDYDFSDATLEAMGPIDRHIAENVRDIVLHGNDEVTCLTCHNVHGRTTLRHRKLAENERCMTCHVGDDVRSGVKAYERHNAVCGY